MVKTEQTKNNFQPEEWNIIPLPKNSKIPKIQWKEYLTKKFPRDKIKEHKGNYAVICGETSNNLIIMDVDLKDKKYFPEIFKQFKATHPELAKTKIVSTPHGFHFYYYMKTFSVNRHKNSNACYNKSNKFTGTLKTKFKEYLKGFDILGNNGYALIPPSKIYNLKYEYINEKEIRTITKSDYNKIRSFFLLEQPKRIRKPFLDILNGIIEIDDQVSKTGLDEHIYWKETYHEALTIYGLSPEELFIGLQTNQPSFDLNKTKEQLNNQLNHEYIYNGKIMTNEKLKEYFPEYKKTNIKKTPKKIIKNKIKSIKTKKKRNKKERLPMVEIKDGFIYISALMQVEIDGKTTFRPKILKQIRLNYNITNRIWNPTSKKTSYFGKEINNNNPTILETSKIRTIVKDNGGSNTDIVQLLNYLSLANSIKEIETVPYFGFYPEENIIKFPPNFIANTITGHGLEFFEYFYNRNTTHQKGKETWFNILKTAENGIGKINALMIGAFSIASPFQKDFKNRNSIIPYLFLLGPVESGKTPAAKYIGCITKYPCLHTNEELTPAIFSQLGSSGCFPLVIDEADGLHNDVQNTIKVLATSDFKRRRSNQDGSIRDSPEFLRTLIFTANNIPDFMINSQAILDRTIFLIIDKRPTNLRNWKQAVTGFSRHNESLLNCLLHEKIDYNSIIKKAQNKTMEIESTRTIKLSNRKLGIFEFYIFGILILKHIGYFNNDENINYILNQIRTLILENGKIGNEQTIEYIKNAITDFNNNYKTYKRLEKNYLELCNIDKDDLQYDNQRATLESQKASVESNKNRAVKQPMSWMKIDKEKQYWLFTFKECSELHKRSKLDSFKNLSELHRTLENYGLKSIIKTTRHIIDKKPKKTIFIPDELFATKIEK